MFSRKKTLGQAIKDLSGLGRDREAVFDDLEDALIEADTGPALSMELVDELRAVSKGDAASDPETIRASLAQMIERRLKAVDIMPVGDAPHCYLFLGVNGVGKTTSIAKFAKRIQNKQPGTGLVFAAADTFRAAACQQLETHGQRLGIRTVSQGAGADSAAVVFDALQSARSQGEKVVLADTAGRLHNKAHLVKELEKVDKIVRQKMADGIYRKILVLDATTGQNGLQQARAFHEAVGVDAVILSKYDSSARGGMALAICRELGLGFAFVGTGEAYENMTPFDPSSFAERLVAP